MMLQVFTNKFTLCTGKMARRVLGSGDAAMDTSAQGFGCMGMTAWYGEPITNDEAVSLLTR
jgi:hypothetical protein